MFFSYLDSRTAKKSKLVFGNQRYFATFVNENFFKTCLQNLKLNKTNETKTTFCVACNRPQRCCL